MASIDRDKLGEYLSAYLDGELSEQEGAALERLLAEDSQARAQFEDLQRTVELVRSLPRHSAPQAMAEDLTAVAEREQLLGEPSDSASRRGPWWLSVRPILSAAAVLLITIGGGLYVLDAMKQPDKVAVTPATVDLPQAPAEKGDRMASEAAEPLAGHGGRARTVERHDKAASRDTGDAYAYADKEDARMGLGVRAREVEPAEEAMAINRGLESAAAARASPVSAGLAAVENLMWSQKVALQTSNADLLEHRFSNESNRLVVLTEDADDELMARSQFEAFALDNDISNVVSLAGAETPTENQYLYFPGRPDVNYTPDDGAEILVQLPASQLEQLAEVVGAGARQRPVSLKIGPVVANGLPQVKRMAQQIGPVELEPLRALGPGEVLADARSAGEDALGLEEAEESIPTRSGYIPATSRLGGAVAADRSRRRSDGASPAAPMSVADDADADAGLGDTARKKDRQESEDVGVMLKQWMDDLLQREKAGEAKSEGPSEAEAADDGLAPGTLVTNAMRQVRRSHAVRTTGDEVITVVLEFVRSPAAARPSSSTQPAAGR